MTLLVSRLLSKTILKGVPSSFTLELPPYRRPRSARCIVRSIFDRTLFVLGRAVAVAAPAGLADLADGQRDGGGYEPAGPLLRVSWTPSPACWGWTASS